MEPIAAGLREQPFGPQQPPLTVFSSAAQRAASAFLADTCTHAHGLGLFQGPPLSGKSTLLRHYAEALPDDRAWAIVDGAGTEPDAFLDDVLAQFGYALGFSTTNERINMLKVFILQQAAGGHPPLLMAENTQGMTPATLAILCDLVVLRVADASALRLVLASDRSMAAMVRAPAMTCIAERMTGSFFVEPLTADETVEYVFAKLEAGGAADPAAVFPAEVCRELHAVSGGWPGVIDRLARHALAKAERCPVDAALIERPSMPEELPALLFRLDEEVEAATFSDAPTLVISHDGETIDELRMTSPRLLIGRSEHNDLRINSRYISRHHALFVRHGNATFLMDLNSTNGTFVNSRRVSNLMMKHEDVVLVGNHRIKFIDLAANERLPMDDPGLSETLVMKSLEDVRRLLARENARAVAPDAASDPSP